MGAATDATPIAAPPIRRHRIRSYTPMGNPWPIDAMKNITAAISMTGRRPNRSASDPVNQAPTAEPMRAIDTTKPMANDPRLNVSLIAEVAPLMTAESQPNSRPPRAAVVARRMTRPVR